MKVSNIAVLVILLLPLYGCDEKTTEEKFQQHASEETNAITPTDAFNALQKDAEAGIASAQRELGELYLQGKDVQRDEVKAVEWLEKAATQSDAKAQFKLSLIYDMGEPGVPIDNVKAVDWLQKSAIQGNIDAQTVLGSMYGGIGMITINGPKDPAKAVEWLQKAANQGDSYAQELLGGMYFQGKGITKDIIKAAEWFEKSALQGDVIAQTMLGFIFIMNDGMPKDFIKAAKWFQKSADQGDEQGQYRIGTLYEDGKGVPKDDVKAAQWYKKSAAKGNSDAQFRLGLLYYQGLGVSKDKVRAYAWLNLAAADNNDDAKKSRDWLEKRLSDFERTQAQQLASNWKKGDTFEDITMEAKPNTAVLKKKISGTVFKISKEGHALTNYHLVNQCEEIRILGQEGHITLLAQDQENDLALVELPNKTEEFAKFNDESVKVRQGEDIVVFGFPLNFVLSSGGNLTPGTISALSGLENNSSQIQITAPIQAGSSGSPVLDKKGNVVGIVTMMLDGRKVFQTVGSIPQNVNFAANGQTIKSFLDTNKIPYKTSGGFFSMEKNNADIADDARKWTAIVECWK
jgi:TPR repeat protein